MSDEIRLQNELTFYEFVNSVSEVITHRADDGKLYETRYYDGSVIAELARRLRSEEAKTLREWLDGKN
ncbi:MAG: hypothetical protein LBQ02_01650 [Candidatus Nomurabacteria bacterium]|nr:hypothetical protein [Candidatus Nomurabacteria bacterium]